MPHHTQTFPLHIKSLDVQGTFSGYASVFDHIDLQSEKVAKGAFYHTLKKWQEHKSCPKLLWQHNPAEPIGIWKNLKEDMHGLYGEGQLLLEIQKAREAYALLQSKAIDSLSIGFKPIVAGIDKKTQVRTLYQIELFEISLVTFAANNKARVLEIKNTF